MVCVNVKIKTRFERIKVGIMLRVLWIAACAGMLWLSMLIGKSDWRQFQNWYAAKNWVETSAELVDLRLNEETKTETTSEGRSYQQTYYQLITRYEYEVDGQQYSNARSSFAMTIDAQPVSYTHLTLPTICSV